ncbi:MAG: NAD(P)/FAD-dependent oxidoreductase, partial [Terrimicrobiaceae bacterium]
VITYQNQRTTVPIRAEGMTDSSHDPNRVMLVRPRKSRIYYLRRFFDYPLTLSLNTMANLGVVRLFKIGVSYIASRLKPVRPEKTLADFFVNRFGSELYRTFFKSYTEKVWGRPCTEISAEWGAQRIKGLDIGKALKNAIAKPFRKSSGDISQTGTETSLIERFLYPKFGPGQLWETCASIIQEKGGEIRMGWVVEKIRLNGNKVEAVDCVEVASGRKETLAGDFFISTMPIKELVTAITGKGIPDVVAEVAKGLEYRDFITVGVLLDRIRLTDPHEKGLIKDNWIYIQEADVRVGRMQIFNNWSPYLVAKEGTVWIGLEYFCDEGDDLWSLSDGEMKALAALELEKMGMALKEDILDSTVIKVEKAYPAYFGSYDRFPVLREWLDGIENLFLVGRNGMHRYNNQDHSMLTAMQAVENIVVGRTNKDNLWEVNTEKEYHESKDDK